MASALLASRNEPYWGEAKVYMRKNPNPNPNPNPSIQNHYNNPGFLLDGRHENHHQIRQMEPEEIAAGAASVSDDSSSLSRRPAGPGRNRDSSVGHITFNLASYSRRELRELKRRLVSELERVRSVASRIDASTRSGGYQPRETISGSDSKKAKKPAPGSEAEKLLSAMMKRCGQILSKLMKHKGAIWFNTPVDVVGMGLHDYHQIIKNPMDLGTVKTKLNKGMYQIPPEFASDIKLTFDNALLYNPEGHEVHRVASQLLKIFEGLYYPAYEKYEKQWNAICGVEEEELKRGIRNSWSPVPDYTRRAEPVTAAAPLPPPNPAPMAPAYGKQLQQPPPPPPPQQQMGGMGRGSTVKQPKPKAKDPNKRAMTLEEKQKLSLGLQSLPDEKMEHVIQIVRRRNGDPMQHGDEILLDFETMDNETLWELDRFVGNCKKTMNKIRRLEALAGANATSAGGASTAPASVHADDGDKSPTAAKRSKKGETGDEDVDIGDEMPSLHYPSVEIEKDTGNASSSSSSGSDSSSSSSDSDSGSSSDSDSGGGEDEAQSPGGAAPDSRPSLP